MHNDNWLCGGTGFPLHSMHLKLAYIICMARTRLFHNMQCWYQRLIHRFTLDYQHKWIRRTSEYMWWYSRKNRKPPIPPYWFGRNETTNCQAPGSWEMIGASATHAALWEPAGIDPGALFTFIVPGISAPGFRPVFMLTRMKRPQPHRSCLDDDTKEKIGLLNEMSIKCSSNWDKS